MNIRLQQLITSEGLNNRRFAEKMGIQSSNVSHIVNGRNKPGYDFIAKMLEVFPNINPYWLILGQGDMYKDTIGNAGAASDGNHVIDSTEKHGLNQNLRQPEQINSDTEIGYSDKNHNGMMNQSKMEFDTLQCDSTPLFQDESTSPISAYTTQKQNNNSPNLPVTNSENIDWIVIFYSDGTFKTYMKR